jgi:hypothetical protein
LDVLCPDMVLEAKKELARKVLDLSRGEEQKPPRVMITPAQVESIIWPNMQCIHPPLTHAAVFESDCGRTQRVFQEGRMRVLAGDDGNDFRSWC